jgi:hypothetical protein
VRLVIDHDDEPAQVAVVARDRNAARRRGEDVRIRPRVDVQAAVSTEPRVVLGAEPVAEAGEDPRRRPMSR